MNISDFATDELLEVKGVWRNIGDGASLKVARANNTAYINMLREEMAPYRSATCTDEEASEILIRVMAKTVLLDWKGLDDKDEKGKRFPIKYSFENAIRLLTKYKEFRNLVRNIAQDIENYRSIGIGEVVADIKKP